MNDIRTWIQIRRYDLIEKNRGEIQKELRQMTFPTAELEYEDLKLMVRKFLGIDTEFNKVVKVRRQDNVIVPMRDLLDGASMEDHFVIDVVRVHQFCFAQDPEPDCVTAFKEKLQELEMRLNAIENKMPTVEASCSQAIEDEAQQMIEKVEFIERRLNELIPAEWEEHINIDIEPPD